MSLSINQIIYAILTILIIVVIVFFGPGLLKELSRALNLNIGLDPGELETQREAKGIAEDLSIDLTNCVNPSVLDRVSCFCLDKPVDLPTGYSFKFFNKEKDTTLELISDRDYKIKEHIISRTNVKGCSDSGQCYSDFKNGIEMSYNGDNKFEFETKNNKFDIGFDNNYVFYYYFDPEERKPFLYMVSRGFAYDKINKGIAICGSNANIPFTDDMRWYLIQQLYK